MEGLSWKYIGICGTCMQPQPPSRCGGQAELRGDLAGILTCMNHNLLLQSTARRYNCTPRMCAENIHDIDLPWLAPADDGVLHQLLLLGERHYLHGVLSSLLEPQCHLVLGWYTNL